MTAVSPARQEPQNNPALNQQAFARAIERNGGTERTDMSAMGTYLKTGFLLLLLIAAGAWGWSQVRFETIRGVVVAIPLTWIWFAFFFTFILAIAGIFAGRFLWLVAILYALAQGALLGVMAWLLSLFGVRLDFLFSPTPLGIAFAVLVVVWRP